jgi:hypothetical protein
MAITLQDIDNMPSAEYKQKLNDPAFLSEVEALLKSPAAVAPVVQPQEVEVDPSMPTRTQVPKTSVRERLAEPVVAPIAPVVAPIAPIVAPIAPVALAVLPELIYEYQPMDEHNRPMGGKQVIKYQTPDELAQKLSEQNTLLIRKLRQVTRENYRGAPSNAIPEDAAHYVATELKAKELTADERFQITQDLNDPEKFASARDRLLESAVGISPAELRQRLNDQQMTILQLRAKENFLTFAQKQDFLTGHGVTDSENAQTLTDWMFKNTLAPTVENFELASSQLRSAGLLNEAPVVQQVPVPQPLAVVPVESVVPQAQEPVVPAVRISSGEPVQSKRHSQVPSGLNDRVSSASGLAPTSMTDNSLTLADIDKMSGDQYKKAARNPAFLATVNRLEKEATIRRHQRGV